MLFINSIAFWFALILVFHVYLGYYTMLYLLCFFKNDNRYKDETHLPHVTFIISAYNEAGVIRQKIENSLGIDYPKDLFEIIVVSDASTDDTDKIVSEYAEKGVLLLRQEKRKGKTEGINAAVPLAKGQILVFSDANAMYQKDAIRKLVRNFADPKVGYATGEARYTEDELSMANKNESLYWSYEISLRKLENKIGSMIGADGAIYAIRKELFTPLKFDDINDFVNPIQIILAGYKGIYEPEAICHEDSAGDFYSEFRRKRRIVNRSMFALCRLKQILNPFRYRLYALQVISHKLIRWMIPFLLVIVFISNIFLLGGHYFYTLFLLLQVAMYSLALIGYFKHMNNKPLTWIFSLPFYFCLVNFASALGIIDVLRGRVTTTWDSYRKGQ
jgi:cellulose synthase/poly-beta-1,6-N-acetylglucosamine synthase-like glycosyltransferase